MSNNSTYGDVYISKGLYLGPTTNNNNLISYYTDWTELVVYDQNDVPTTIDITHMRYKRVGKTAYILVIMTITPSATVAAIDFGPLPAGMSPSAQVASYASYARITNPDPAGTAVDVNGIITCTSAAPTVFTITPTGGWDNTVSAPYTVRGILEYIVD